MTETIEKPVGDGLPAAEARSALDEMALELARRKQKALQMGGAEKVEKQHQKGKLSVRERLDLLFDPGTFMEFGLLATGKSTKGDDYDPDKTAADGVITGHGKVEGRDVYV